MPKRLNIPRGRLPGKKDPFGKPPKPKKKPANTPSRATVITRPKLPNPFSTETPMQRRFDKMTPEQQKIFIKRTSAAINKIKVPTTSKPKPRTTAQKNARTMQSLPAFNRARKRRAAEKKKK